MQKNRLENLILTCLNPGTSPTAVPSLRTQIISGGGLPLARHSTTDPVEFEKSIRLSGSLINTGPFISFSLFDGAQLTRIGTFTAIINARSIMKNLAFGIVIVIVRFRPPHSRCVGGVMIFPCKEKSSRFDVKVQWAKKPLVDSYKGFFVIFCRCRKNLQEKFPVDIKVQSDFRLIISERMLEDNQ